jgi:hypothetical protein
MQEEWRGESCYLEDKSSNRNQEQEKKIKKMKADLKKIPTSITKKKSLKRT